MDAFWVGWMAGMVMGGIIGFGIKFTLDEQARIRRERQERERIALDRRFEDLGRRLDTIEGRARSAT